MWWSCDDNHTLTFITGLVCVIPTSITRDFGPDNIYYNDLINIFNFVMKDNVLMIKNINFYRPWWGVLWWIGGRNRLHDTGVDKCESDSSLGNGLCLGGVNRLSCEMWESCDSILSNGLLITENGEDTSSDSVWSDKVLTPNSSVKTSLTTLIPK